MAAVGGAGVGGFGGFGGGGEFGGRTGPSSRTTVTASPEHCYQLHDKFETDLSGYIFFKPDGPYKDLVNFLIQTNRTFKANRAPPGTNNSHVEGRSYLQDNIQAFTEALEEVFPLMLEDDIATIIGYGFANKDALEKELKAINMMYDTILECYNMNRDGSVISDANSRAGSAGGTPYSSPPPGYSRKRSRRNRRKSRKSSRKNRRKSRKSRRRKNY